MFLSPCSDIWWCSDELKIYLESASLANSVMTHRGKERGSGRHKNLSENEKELVWLKKMHLSWFRNVKVWNIKV